MKNREIQSMQIRICNACKQYKKCDKELCTMSELVAKELSRFYQPKLPEDSVVLSKEEFWKLSNKFSKKELDEIVEFHKNKARKETAEKIFNSLIKEIDKRKSCGNADVVVYELAKQFGVDLGE